MKKMFIIMWLLATISSAYALTSEFVVNSATQYPGTCGQGVKITVPVTATSPVLIQTPSTGCTMSVNSYSATNNLPIPANTAYKFQTPSGVKNLVFNCSSSAMNYIYVVK